MPLLRGGKPIRGGSLRKGGEDDFLLCQKINIPNFAGYFKLLSNRFTQFCFFIRTLISLDIYFRMCIFSLLIILCLKCQELIFAMFQFSPGVFFRDFVQTSIGSNFRTYLQAHKYCQEFDMLACILFTFS